MSYQAVRAYFEHAGIAGHITEHSKTGDTVEHAAQTIGCTPAEIAKAFSFLVDSKPVVAGPFAVNAGVSVYPDASLKRFSVIHTAAGTDMATIRLTMAELEEHACAAGWVDVCKGWLANEGVPV